MKITWNEKDGSTHKRHETHIILIEPTSIFKKDSSNIGLKIIDGSTFSTSVDMRNWNYKITIKGSQKEPNEFSGSNDEHTLKKIREDETGNNLFSVINSKVK